MTCRAYSHFQSAVAVHRNTYQPEREKNHIWTFPGFSRSTYQRVYSVYLFIHSCCSFITLRAKLSGAVYCNRSCLFVCLFLGLWVCYHDNSKPIDLHQTRSVGEGSDHLQLIKFWPSCAPSFVSSVHNATKPTVLYQKDLSDISTFLQERQKRDFKQLSLPLLFGK